MQNTVCGGDTFLKTFVLILPKQFVYLCRENTNWHVKHRQNNVHVVSKMQSLTALWFLCTRNREIRP